MLVRYLSKPVLLAASCCFIGCAPGGTGKAPSGIAASGPTSGVPVDQGQLMLDASPGQSASETDDGSPQSQIGPSQPAAGSADMPDAGADGGNGQPPPPPAQCDFADGGCVAQCNQPQMPQVTQCSVITSTTLCELVGFVGASTQVACGQQAMIGTACCGQCGCVPVEMFYDGTYCWEGVPTCALSYLTDQFYEPHLPGPPDGGPWISAAANGIIAPFYIGTTPPDAGADSGDDSDGGTADDDGGAATADAGTPGMDVDATPGMTATPGAATMN